MPLSVAVVVEVVASIAVDIKSIAEAEGLTYREQRVAAYSFAEKDVAEIAAAAAADA